MASNQHKVDRQNSEESADSLKTLNEDLRNHLVKLRSQLESQKGSIKQAQWQKVLNVRNVRELEQEKYAQSMDSLRSKLKGEKNRELENLRTSLQLRHESEMLRLVRQKDVEITKLGQELDLKERMLRKLLGENRRGSLNLTPFAKRNKLLNELSELRTCKKELTETLEQVNGAERQHDLELRRTADSWESELQRIRRDAHLEIKNLVWLKIFLKID
ncbi:hypothetical protein LOTGIDRAFT_162184 [Lottia gigantea]|uniref:Uncharacterized protein n=1 Tax=Lottia gigantea TaxID=225164 RepID=V4A8R9_LOTGI|nr:hypothetical protein LOTGIDRAFT_162184 [Lottia gigantea]ESO93152.1 hypothetical protein LOTGIDRAFT_162184 [Lottia gigantea]